MNILRNNFLYEAKARNKTIYFLLCAALMITAITSAAGLQITPFLVYGMYSTPEPVTDTFVTYSLECDGQSYNAPEIWNYHRKAMFNFTIEQYLAYKENKDKDPYEDKSRNILGKAGIHNEQLLKKLYNSEAEIAQYPSWLKKYMQANLGRAINTINIFRVVAGYDQNGTLKTTGKELILAIR